MNISDLRDAIRTQVFVKASPQHRIVSADGKVAPWLFDFRALLLQPRWLNEYAELFWQTYADRYPFQVCAMESAGIALVSAIVMKGVERKQSVNGLFIRKSRKKSGLLKQLEGTPNDKPLILVDDLINSGQTFSKQIDILKEVGQSVNNIFTVLAFRDMSAYGFATERGIRVHSLFTLLDFDLPLQSARSPHMPRDEFDVIWKFAAPAPSHEFVVQKSTPVIDDKNVYFGSDTGTFFALAKESGEVRWQFETGKHPPGKGIFSSPAVSAGSVFFGAYDGNVYALNTADGKPVWVYDNADWIGSSPAIAENLGLLFIGLEFGLLRKRGGIIALDIKTGQRRWSARMPELTHGSPLYIKEKNLVVIGSNDGVVYAYEAETGRRLWEYATGGDIKTSFAYDASLERIYFGSMDGKVYALSADTGIPAWAYETGAGIYSTPLVHGSMVYVSSLDKSIYAIDTESGRTIWSFDTAGRVFASPQIFNGSLWCGSNDGRLYELDPATGTLRSFFQTTERIVNAIAHNPSTKFLYAPTAANEIYCIEKKKKPSAE